MPVTAPTNALAGLPPSYFAFDGFELDEVRFELRAAGTVVPMEPQVFDLLRFMVRNQDRVLTKDELLDAIWPERYVTEAALNSRVMSARKALGDDGRQQRYIKTVHGRGYRFVAHVTVGEGTPPAQPGPLAPVPAPVRWQRVDLPAHSTSFIGRETEVARLVDLLVEECRPLVSIVGPGGVGKTRLAIAAAERLQNTGLQVVYVSLEPVADAAELPGVFAGALGLTPSSSDTSAELLRHLASSRLLFVLDNLEQIAAGAAPFIADLLEAAPQVQILATSRVVLALQQEWVFRVDGLDFCDTNGGCTECGARRLFLERARQANAAAPEPTDDDLCAVDDIVRLVAGMPLAIELAASLTPYLPYSEIAALLSDGSACLTTDVRNASPRHRNMNALFEDTCRYLDPGELRMLEALSVFEGPFGASAASQVAGAALPVLRRLVDKSLVQPVDGRFALHPLMRQFLRERCAGRLDDLRRVSAEHYASFLASRESALNGRGQIAATREINAEFANVAAAWRWAAAHDRIDLLEQATYPFFCFLTFRGRFFEAHEMATIALPVVERAGDSIPSFKMALLMHHFWVLSRLGRTREALSTLSRVNELASRGDVDIRPGIGMEPLTAVAAVQLAAGNYGAAAQAALAALESARRREDPRATAFAAWLAGASRVRQATLVFGEISPGAFGYQPSPDSDDPDALTDAARLGGLAASILEAAGETWLRGYVEIERGLIAESIGERAAAVEHFRTSCELRREIGDPQGTASALIYLADRLIDQDVDEAEEIYREARELFTQIGDAQGVAEAERFNARLALAREDYDGARDAFLRTLEVSGAIGFTNNVLSAFRGLGRILHVTGRLRQAAVLHAFVAAHPSPTPFSRATAEYDLAEVARICGDDVAEAASAEAAAMGVGAATDFALAAFAEAANAS